MIELIQRESTDLICAVLRLATRETQKEKKRELGINGIPEIEQWITSLENNLNPFLLSDIDLLIRQLPVTSWIMIRLSRETETDSSIEGFFRKLESLNDTGFVSLVKASLGFEDRQTPTEKDILYSLTETSSDALIEPDKEAGMIFNMLNNPSDYLSRIKKLYLDFYNEAFKASLEVFRELSEKRLAWHKEQLKKDRDAYLNGVSRGLFTSLFESAEKPDIFYSFYFDFDVFISTDHVPLIIIGAGTDEIIKSRTNRIKTDILFVRDLMISSVPAPIIISGT